MVPYQDCKLKDQRNLRVFHCAVLLHLVIMKLLGFRYAHDVRMREGCLAHKLTRCVALKSIFATDQLRLPVTSSSGCPELKLKEEPPRKGCLFLSRARGVLNNRH